MPHESRTLDLPRVIAGHYRVESELGRGAAARVYAVLDERSGQRRALKHACAEPERAEAARSALEREYRALVDLVHPHIVRAFEQGEHEGAPFFTMELLDGMDACEIVPLAAPSVGQICRWLHDGASALALVHARGCVHRDVSPRNLWCLPGGRAKLIDFGTLAAAGPQTRMVGTPPYVAPETLYTQSAEARSDLFSLGALAYWLLAGHNAFPARELCALPAFWQCSARSLQLVAPELPSALCVLVMQLLSLEANERPGSAREVCERLQGFALG